MCVCTRLRARAPARVCVARALTYVFACVNNEPLSPKQAQLAHSDSELLFSSLYLTLLFFSHPHFILPHTLSTIFHRTYARSTHSQNLKEKHSSTYFLTHAHAPDI